MNASSIIRFLFAVLLSASLVCEAGSNRPIGVFDSGTGGLTVLEKLLASDAFDNCTGLTSVIFKNTSGWYVTTSYGASSGTNVTVTDAPTNATNLNTTYSKYYWCRK